jgi:translation elongation factor EF-1beta
MKETKSKQTYLKEIDGKLVRVTVLPSSTEMNKEMFEKIKKKSKEEKEQSNSQRDFINWNEDALYC